MTSDKNMLAFSANDFVIKRRMTELAVAKLNMFFLINTLKRHFTVELFCFYARNVDDHLHKLNPSVWNVHRSNTTYGYYR